MALTVEIVTPAKVAWKGEVGEVQAPGVLGEFGVTTGLVPTDELLGRLCDALERSHAGADTRAAAWLERLELSGVERRRCEELSKGQQQKIQFIASVLHDPAVLILDEPTDGLDPNQKHEVRKLIKAMAEDKAIVLSTHILEEVEAICNRIIVIDQGRVRVDETPDEFKARKPGSSIDEIFREITSSKAYA